MSALSHEQDLPEFYDHQNPYLSQEDRLNKIAQRENTVIDNPYQQSLITHNWTRQELNIPALRDHTAQNTAARHLAEAEIENNI